MAIKLANLILGKLDSRVRGNDSTPKRASGLTEEGLKSAKGENGVKGFN